MKRWMGTLSSMGLLVGCVLPDELTFLHERAEACGKDIICAARESCVEGFCMPTEIDSQACTPACVTSYEACTRSGRCEPRYVSLTLSRADGRIPEGRLTVLAELRASPAFEPRYPATLKFQVDQTDGGITSGNMLRYQTPGEGAYYGTDWSPPGPGVFFLTASHPENGVPSSTIRLTR